MEAQHHKAGEKALAPPQRHVHPQGGRQQAVGRAGDGVGVEEVLPHHGQRPLGHDVGEDEDGAEVLPPGQVGAGNEEGEHAAKQDGHHAGAHRQQHGVQQGRPEIGLCQAAGEEVHIVHHGVPRGLAGEVGVNGAGVDFEGVLHDGDDGGHGSHRQHNAHQHQDNVVGLGKKGLDLIEENGEPAGLEGGRLIHRNSS